MTTPRAFARSSAISAKGTSTKKSAPPSHTRGAPQQAPTISLLETIQQLKGPARWVIIGSLAIAATAETTFWAKVIQAKFFAAEDDVAAVEFLNRCQEALGGFQKAWLGNYQKHFCEVQWGL